MKKIVVFKREVDAYMAKHGINRATRRHRNKIIALIRKWKQASQ